MSLTGTDIWRPVWWTNQAGRRLLAFCRIVVGDKSLSIV